jgi:glycine/D-amino acid oxidase-like deaminating enzyme
VTDDGERTECERLLIAAGPWTRPLAQLLGADLPLIVERHVVATFGWGTAPRFSFGFADLPGGYYFKPEGADLFCLGPLDEGAQVDPDDFDQEISSLESDELAGALVERVPALADAEARGGWASLYDVSPDWQPVIGEIADGIFVDAGTSGHGFKLAPALGRHIADLVTGKPVYPGLEQFHPSRFGEGRELAAGYGAVRILG